MAWAAVLVALAAAIVFAVTSLSGGHAPGTAAKGAVSVLYAASLTGLMEGSLGPAFARATGYGFAGHGGGSGELASQIRDGVRRGDVFISASPSADVELMGASHGGWVRWYLRFASSPLVLGYNPRSQFAAVLRGGRPWYEALVRKGTLVGMTDPKLDPQGRLSVEAVEEAAAKLPDRTLGAALGSFSTLSETDLIARLHAGQIDAGFIYADEAAAAHLPSVALTPAQKAAEYTITVLDRAHHPAGAVAFVRHLLAAQSGRSAQSEGLLPAELQLFGERSAVPAGLRQIAGAR